VIEYEGGLTYLEVEDALVLYGALFDCTPAEARDQLRTYGGLESALTRPVQFAFYQDADLALQTAVLAHEIAEGQCFIDGNKRRAFLVCKSFLQANGFRFGVGEDMVAEWIVELSEELTVEELSDQIRAELVSS